MQSGHFRQDLFYRLNVLQVSMPALREIASDIPVIAMRTLARIASGMTVALAPSAITALTRYSFPGNVRELENVLERAMALGRQSARIEVSDLRLTVDDNPVTQAAATSTPTGSGTLAGRTPLQDSFRSRRARNPRAGAGADAAPHPGRQTAGITFRSMRWPERLALNRTMNNALAIDPAAAWDAGWWLAAERRYSPNFNARPEGTTVDLVVLHHISLPPGVWGDEVAGLFENRLNPCGNAELEAIVHLQVSAHFFCAAAGLLQQFVSCDDRAWQTGVSCWHGRHACNDYSIGIEIEGDAVQPFTTAQYAGAGPAACRSHRCPLSGPRCHHAQ